MKRILILLAALLAACAVAPAADSPAAEAAWLWVYAPTNFQVDANADHLIELIRSERSQPGRGNRGARLSGRARLHVHDVAEQL